MVKRARTETRGTRWTVLIALGVAGAALMAALALQSVAPASSSAGSPISGAPTATPPARGGAEGVAPAGTMPLRARQAGALTEADGILPDGVTVFDGQYPGIANLEPALLGALRQAATAASADGVEILVTSGWRSLAYQQQLFRQAVAEYGSEAKAARWVAAPGASDHESGNAVDVGPSDATAWLSAHGARYGLCQIYRNEPWHFELRPSAAGQGCPPMFADASQDPRSQR